MYSNEINDFIKSKNNVIGGDDLLFLINSSNHPQISEITFHPENNTYTIKTNDNYIFNFYAMPYKEAVCKKLVKSHK